MRLEFSACVEGDLDAIAAYIARDNPRRALTFLNEIRTEILAIGRHPHHYRLRLEIGDQARMGIVGRYIILFRVLPDVVRIERVVYGGRDLPALLEGREP